MEETVGWREALSGNWVAVLCGTPVSVILNFNIQPGLKRIAPPSTDMWPLFEQEEREETESEECDAFVPPCSNPSSFCLSHYRTGRATMIPASLRNSFR